MYGAESWCLSQEDCCKLKIFERKMIKKMYDTTQVDGQWKLRSNAEDKGLLKNMNFIRVYRLRWEGHAARMERWGGGDRLQKIILKSRFTGKIRKGRARSR